VTIIAGYLGAGKTTLINQMLTDNDGQRLALLVNDFGEINIDAKLVESQDSDTVNLSNGCVCCSLAEDFSRALSQIEKRSDQFDRIIVEMSGIGEPHKVVEWVRNSTFILDGIVVLADTTTILNWAENRYAGPLIRRQISAADLILLTHTDLIDQRTVNDVREWLIELTPAPVLQTPVSMPLIIGFNRSSDNNL
jgi:G3E family GTPase